MSYKATVYNVMIASPSDVLKERSIASDVVNSWNPINSEKAGIVLLPIGWETHSAPLMGNRAQEIINKQVTDKGDLLIGIFWTRIGTKTGDSESGTIEEIERHIANGKPAMLYFSEAPVRPESIDRKQYERLQKFKSKCLARGLVVTFESIEEFREKLKNQIALTITDNNYFISSSKNISNSVSDELGNDNERNHFEKIRSNISKEAIELLLNCAKTESTISLFKFIGDKFLVQADKEYEGNGQRELAKWKSIFKELELYGLIKAYNYKGEIYDLTNKGYEFADYLNDK